MQEVKEHIAPTLVPQLRFKEFDGEWEKHSLKHLLGALVDCEHKTAPYVDDSEYLVVRTNNVKGGQLVYKDIKYTTEVGFKEWTKRLVPKFGDILFTREAPAGESCLVPNDKKVCLGQRMVLLRSNENKMTGQYLSSYLQSGSAIRDISNLSIGTTVTRINIADIYKLNCPVSTIPEQQKIASFLSAVDEKIQQLTKKKALLEDYKKGVMQHLFSGQLRFKDEEGKEYPDWEEKRLGVLSEIVGGGTPETAKEEYWGGEVQWFTPTEIRSRFISDSVRTITQAGLKKSSAKLLPIGTILFTSRATIAELGFAMKECSTNQGFQSLIVNEKNNSEFIYYLIKKNKKEFIRKSQGSTFLEISSKEMKKMKFNTPCLEEQQKIASYLSSIDTKIERVINQITQTQSFKKGLLQQMFV